MNLKISSPSSKTFPILVEEFDKHNVSEPKLSPSSDSPVLIHNDMHTAPPAADPASSPTPPKATASGGTARLLEYML
ncbi:Hypothetical predicted protein, partial [Marmota monax]